MKTMLKFFFIGFCVFGCRDKTISYTEKSVAITDNNIKNSDYFFFEKKIDVKPFDSVVFYKDVNYFSYKGINRISADSIKYPFAVFYYLPDKLIVEAHFNSKEIFNDTLRTYKDYKYTSRKTRREGKYFYNLYSFYVNGDSILEISINYNDDIMNKSTRVKDIGFLSQINDTTYKTSYWDYIYEPKMPYFFQAIENPAKIYEGYSYSSESTYSFKNGIFYSTYEKRQEGEGAEVLLDSAYRFFKKGKFESLFYSLKHEEMQRLKWKSGKVF